ncbi:glycoside hydrolase [Fulvivirga sp. M361]|uniref:sugar-binding domain-containing protein n=1 Tax=Fulvivirga sp. M361 TaxID=2594266 RepID=UPI00117B0913|nr:sugar-binding domain-containing protein [Fulvivirga sp. M361]TRX61192.1 glycoside hydrolase [Fulvivirga sp. M361]
MKKIAYIILLLSACLEQGYGQLISLRGRWQFTIGDKAVYAKPDYDDADWEGIWAPSAWEEEGFHGYDGFAWYRKKFDGKLLPKEEKIYVNLGYIDDADEVYINGELIGFSGVMPPRYRSAYNAQRSYVIPGSVINYAGENLIAVRVFDSQGEGGMVDGELGIYPVEDFSPMLVDLQGLWSFALSRDGGVISDNENWDKIMVPMHWEKQGYRRYDGYAWYRNTFELTEDYGNEVLVLMLGKIDDFDEVYINGELIGATNDHRKYMQSQSYDKFRAYDIPKHVLAPPGKTNSVEVLVHDIGNLGGIYQGPVGITTKSKYYRYYR